MIMVDSDWLAGLNGKARGNASPRSHATRCPRVNKNSVNVKMPKWDISDVSFSRDHRHVVYYV
jgi:hypothetical protein